MIRTAASALTAVLTLAACSSSGGSSGDQSGPYAQTWNKSYGDTTCGEYVHQMTSHERFAFAHDVIVRLGARDTSDAFAEQFAMDVLSDCQPAPGLKLSEAAAALATVDTQDFG